MASNNVYFSPSFGNRPKTLVGREEILSLIQAKFTADPAVRQAILLTGQRGIGKTALLLEIAEYAKKNNHIVASPTMVYTGMVTRILEKLKVDVDDNSSECFVRQLSKVCDKASSTGKIVLIIIDEAQGRANKLKQLIAAYQELIQAGKNIAIIFAGLPDCITKGTNDPVSAFYKDCFQLEVGSIDINDVVSYLSDSLIHLGVMIPEKWVFEAARITEGLPYMMQLVGSYIVEDASDTGKVTEEVFHQACNLAVQDYISDVCVPTVVGLSDRDKDFLRAMADDEQESKINDISDRLNMRAANVQTYKSRLSQAGIIEQPRRGYVKYAVPYLREYFQKES